MNGASAGAVTLVSTKAIACAVMVTSAAGGGRIGWRSRGRRLTGRRRFARRTGRAAPLAADRVAGRQPARLEQRRRRRAGPRGPHSSSGRRARRRDVLEVAGRVRLDRLAVLLRRRRRASRPGSGPGRSRRPTSSHPPNTRPSSSIARPDRAEERPERRPRHVDARRRTARGSTAGRAGTVAARRRGRRCAAPRPASTAGSGPGRSRRGPGSAHRTRGPRNSSERADRGEDRRHRRPRHVDAGRGARRERAACRDWAAGARRRRRKVQTRTTTTRTRMTIGQERDDRAPVRDDELRRQVKDAGPEVLQRSAASSGRLSRSWSRRRGRRP